MTFTLLFGDSCRHLQCCLDRVTLYGFQDFSCNRSVWFKFAERDAPSRGMINVRTAAMIAWHLAMRTAGSIRDFMCVLSASIV
jgi:hypothetical protein